MDAVIDKLSEKHSVDLSEVIEVLQSKATFRFVEKGHRRGENVYAALGQSEAGRYMIVFFILKVGNRALILSARDMTSSERRRHEKS